MRNYFLWYIFMILNNLNSDVCFLLKSAGATSKILKTREWMGDGFGDLLQKAVCTQSSCIWNLLKLSLIMGKQKIWIFMLITICSWLRRYLDAIFDDILYQTYGFRFVLLYSGKFWLFSVLAWGGPRGTWTERRVHHVQLLKLIEIQR